MTKTEFLEYVRKNNIDLKKYNFVIGEKSNTPYTVGCYEEGEKWYLYEVGERQNFSIVKSGDEKKYLIISILNYEGILVCKNNRDDKSIWKAEQVK